MINFRYHVVTLVAVFLALGLGVLFGASFIDQNTVKALETAQNRLSDRNGRLVERVRQLETEKDRFDMFAGSARQYLIAGTLTDRPAVVVSFESTTKDTLEATIEALLQSGARVDGSYQLSSNLDLANQTRREQVALAFGGDASDEEALAKLAAGEVAAVLAAKKAGGLSRLIDSGLASTRNEGGISSKDPAGLPAAGSLVVIVSGDEETKAMTDRFSSPMVASLVGQGAILAVVSASSPKADSLMARTRSQRGLRAITVDGINTASGQTALVLGLQAAIAGRFGHYGVAEGADSPIPEVQPRS